MPTATFSVASNDDDGYGECDDTVWPPSTATFVDRCAGNPGEMYALKDGSTFLSANCWVRWNTGATIPSTATINSAKILVYPTFRNAADGSGTFKLVADYYDFGGCPSVVSDYTLTASPSIFTAVNYMTWTLNAVNEIVLTDLTGIMRSGESNGQGIANYTGVRFTLDEPITPTGQNYVLIAPLEHATGQEPRLEVTYTEAPTGGPIAWVRA